jgi:hypothetical protein
MKAPEVQLLFEPLTRKKLILKRLYQQVIRSVIQSNQSHADKNYWKVTLGKCGKMTLY